MSKPYLLFFLTLNLIISACSSSDEELNEFTIIKQLDDLSFFESNTDYLNSPYVTAGDRLYIVGHQNGTFPDLGWHVSGEMGGVWDHPIKLLDGFAFKLSDLDLESSFCLNNAEKFITYPFLTRKEFLSQELDLKVDQFSFIPDQLEGAIIELRIENLSEDEKDLEIEFTGMVDLSPVWLWDSLDISDGVDEVEWDEERQLLVGTDTQNPWFTVLGSNRKVSDHYFVKNKCYSDRKGKGKDATLTNQITIGPGEVVSAQYYISGSFESREDALNTYQNIAENTAEHFQNKANRYKNIIQQSEISIPDKELQTMYDWVKYNTDWLIRDVKGIGRGVSAGIPDYPWWFGTDNGYTLEGLLSTGRHEEVRKTIELIYNLSDQVNGNGRVIHEASTNGVVFNYGNINTTARFIHLLWKYFEWTGDVDFLRQYFPKVKSGLEWLESMDENGNLFPDGHGMMEIHGLDTEMIDVAAYTQLAYQDAAKMAVIMEDSMASSYEIKAAKLKELINTEWWVEESNSYADFQATKDETISLIDAAITRADTLKKPWAVEELEAVKETVSNIPDNSSRGFVVHHNWVVNTPLETGIASIDKAEPALETARRYTNQFGVYVTGIDRDENQSEAEKWQSFSYVGAVMTLPTGVQAIAECNYGNPDQALNYLKKLNQSFSYAFPGSLYEVSPDYGMITQAWTIYAVAVPIVDHFFGIEPNAYVKQIVIEPDFPTEWENAQISNVRVGDNLLDYNYYRSSDNEEVFEFYLKNEGWEIQFQVDPSMVNEITVNDKVVEFSDQKKVNLKLEGKKNIVKINN